MSAPPAEPTLQPADYARFRELVRIRTGLEIPDMRRRDLERALAEALERTGAEGFDELHHLLSDPLGGREGFAAMLPQLTVGETHFFRYRAQIDALEQRILPDLLERRAASRRLRIWSAGCASGEEPYTVAIVLDRLLPRASNWKVEIVGTDINPAALDKARRREYGRWSFRDVPDEVRSRYFSDAGNGRFRLDDEIGGRVSFKLLNLIEDDFPADMDLVLCRNVLIYFRPETVALVVQRLHDAIAPDGWLLVGHVEPSQDVFESFRVQNLPGTVAYQKAVGGAEAPAPRPRQVPPPTRARRPPRPRRPPRERPEPPPPPPPPPASDEEGFERAATLLTLGRQGDALAIFEALAVRDPRAAFEAAKICAGQLQLEAAERWIDLAEGERALTPGVNYLRGVILQERGELEEAQVALRRCLYADPEFVLGHLAIAGLLTQLGDRTRAAKAIENAAALVEGRDDDERVPDGDGLTYGRLRELVTLKRELMAG